MSYAGNEDRQYWFDVLLSQVWRLQATPVSPDIVMYLYAYYSARFAAMSVEEAKAHAEEERERALLWIERDGEKGVDRIWRTLAYWFNRYELDGLSAEQIVERMDKEIPDWDSVTFAGDRYTPVDDPMSVYAINAIIRNKGGN